MAACKPRARGFTLSGYAELETLLAAFREANIAVREMKLGEADLEQAFLKLTSREGASGVSDALPSPAVRSASATGLRLGPGFKALFYKECLRFWKVAFQTIVAPVVTTLLYLLIFSHVLESNVKVTMVASPTPHS